jgi:hypothetical protein
MLNASAVSDRHLGNDLPTAVFRYIITVPLPTNLCEGAIPNWAMHRRPSGDSL